MTVTTVKEICRRAALAAQARSMRPGGPYYVGHVDGQTYSDGRSRNAFTADTPKYRLYERGFRDGARHPPPEETTPMNRTELRQALRNALMDRQGQTPDEIAEGLIDHPAFAVIPRQASAAMVVAALTSKAFDGTLNLNLAAHFGTSGPLQAILDDVLAAVADR